MFIMICFRFPFSFRSIGGRSVGIQRRKLYRFVGASPAQSSGRGAFGASTLTAIFRGQRNGQCKIVKDDNRDQLQKKAEEKTMN